MGHVSEVDTLGVALACVGHVEGMALACVGEELKARPLTEGRGDGDSATSGLATSELMMMQRSKSRPPYLGK